MEPSLKNFCFYHGFHFDQAFIYTEAAAESSFETGNRLCWYFNLKLLLTLTSSNFIDRNRYLSYKVKSEVAVKTNVLMITGDKEEFVKAYLVRFLVIFSTRY